MDELEVGGASFVPVARSLERLEEAVDALRSRVDEPSPSSLGPGMDVAVLLEIARSAERAVQDLCLHLAEAALVQGVDPTILGWPSPNADKGPSSPS